MSEMDSTQSNLHPATVAMRERTFSNLSSRASSHSRSSMGRNSTASFKLARTITFITDADSEELEELEELEEEVDQMDQELVTNDEHPMHPEESFLKELQDEVPINLDPIDTSDFTMDKIPELIQTILLKMGVPQKNLLDNDIKSKSQTQVIIALGKYALLYFKRC